MRQVRARHPRSIAFPDRHLSALALGALPTPEGSDEQIGGGRAYSRSPRRTKPTSRPSGVVTRKLVRLRVTHALEQIFRANAGADSARAWRHRLFDGFVRVGGDGLAAEAAEHDPLFVDDDAGVPAGGADPCTNVGEPVGER